MRCCCLDEFKAQDAGLGHSKPWTGSHTLGLCSILPLSHCTRALEILEEQSKKHRLPSVAPSLGLTCGAQGCGFELEEEVASFLSLFFFKIDLCHVPIIVLLLNRCNVAACNWCCLLKFQFRNIALWLAAVLKITIVHNFAYLCRLVDSAQCCLNVITSCVLVSNNVWLIL